MTKQQFDRRQRQGNEGSSWGVKGVTAVSTPMALGLILLVALIAFEMFNFDTTRFALASLLGDVRFVGVSWAGILAVAFCAIDFAGLVRFFMPDEGTGRQTEYWYLTGAWLLGATMNAIMTWWAVSLTLLNHDLGNEILSRAQLLEIVPIFVAALVWLTRILFIGAFTVAGGYLFAGMGKRPQTGVSSMSHPAQPQRQPQAVRAQPQVVRAQPQTVRAQPQTLRAQPRPQSQPVQMPEPILPNIETVPAFLVEDDEPELIPFDEPTPVMPQPAVPATGLRPQGAANTRIQRRPPTPAARRAPMPMGAKGRGQR
ncbi:MAG: hypothetical protein H6660_06355 [Ardenticatenaceae bacterium]|nr:hypothetical protein [Ardenticatenaceae bacterium]